VLACAEPPEGDTLTEPLLLEPLLLEVLLLVSSLDSLSWVTPLVFALVDELSSLAVVVVDRVASVASRAARPKPAVAAMAVTARPAVTAAARRLPCSRDVMVPPSMACTEHRGGP
jgi:hypothetical protein